MLDLQPLRVDRPGLPSLHPRRGSHAVCLAGEGLSVAVLAWFGVRHTLVGPMLNMLSHVTSLGLERASRNLSWVLNGDVVLWVEETLCHSPREGSGANPLSQSQDLEVLMENLINK